jgi:hypothetical protein
MTAPKIEIGNFDALFEEGGAVDRYLDEVRKANQPKPELDVTPQQATALLVVVVLVSQAVAWLVAKPLGTLIANVVIRIFKVFVGGTHASGSGRSAHDGRGAAGH